MVQGPSLGWWLGKDIGKASRFIDFGGHVSMVVRVGVLKANGSGILVLLFTL